MNASMFCVLLDATQDISVNDQCALVGRSVTDQLHEGLIICHDNCL